jgi:2-polyprenyl-3-methyl-5-hydroxy-6-metoxy-1,4-benzoquinol methylase
VSSYSGTDNLEVMAEAINYNDFLLNLIKHQVNPGKRVLDIGAGIGTFAQALVREAYDVTCFEPDEQQAAGIRRNGIEVTESLHSLKDRSFDFIYSLNVLEHIEDDHQAIRDWYRLLNCGGTMLIYVPAFSVLYSTMDKKVGHYRRYSKSVLCAMAAAMGGHVLTSRYVDSLGFLASLLYRFANDGTGDLNVATLKVYDRFVFPVSRVLDVVLAGVVGKNLYIVVRKPG